MHAKKASSFFFSLLLLLSYLHMMMNAKSLRKFSSLHLVLFLTLISVNTHLGFTTDTISPGQPLVANQTVVSKGGNFELGFFRPGGSRNFYIGIWYKKIPKQTVIWIANRESPISNTSSSELKISEDGNLVLSHSKIQIWSSKSRSPILNSTVAVLFDTGNLVLRDQTNSSNVAWQSFHHPTDTWVPESFIGMNKITGEYQTLTSWKNVEDPAPGFFSDSIDPAGTNEYFLLWNGSQSYWRSGAWNGHYFNLVPVMQPLIKVIFVNDSQWRGTTCTLYNKSTITRMVMDLTGQVKQFVWLHDSQEWLMFWSQPTAQCDVYSLCGAFSICDQGSLPPCRCPQGFQPASPRNWSLEDWSSGCQRKTPLRCGGGDQFFVMPNVQLPVNSQPLKVQSHEECKVACLNNCSCNAYAYTNGCLVWCGELQNLRYDDGGTNTSLYLRLAASELMSSGRNNKTVYVVVAVAVVSVLTILVGLAWRYHRKMVTNSMKELEGSLVLFTYADLRVATRNFSEKLGGGGFGSVYKGLLPDSTVVAVKKLEGLRQGEKQFRTEVGALGSLQHVNLIRLHGFCSEGTKKLLVYEFMSNGSLDSYLFRNDGKILNWRARYEIFLGIARGLAYLHEECVKCIIHCDVKPENILLDARLCPKVSDFGLAKLVGRDFSRVLTTMRGTVGYLAPEWISGQPITPKADVYSFGMMLFELISGRRNKDHPEVGESSFFPVWAANRVVQGEFPSLLDAKLEEDVNMDELSRACKVACWCIQESEAHRPSMGQVVCILEGFAEVNMPPVPQTFQHLFAK